MDFKDSNNNSATNIIDPDNQESKGFDKLEGKLQKEKEEIAQKPQPRKIWFWELFRFAEKFDYLLMALGSLGAIAMGASMPAFAFLMGDMLNGFASADEMVQESKKTMLTFIYVGIGVFFAGWLMFACWMVTGERQAINCRKAYLKSLLRQQIGWFDTVNQTELASKFSTDTFAFQGAIGEKISTFIMTISNIIIGLIFGFVKGWLMSLVLLATLPALAMAGFLYIYVLENKYATEQEMYMKAGGKAEQAISAVKTVKQLSGEQFQASEYKKCLTKASENSFKFALFTGIGMAAMILTFFSSYGLGFWFGSKCVLGTENCPQRISGKLYSAGDVIVVFFSVALGGIQLSQLTPSFRKIIEGRVAGARIFEIIDREPSVRNPPNGIKINNLQGRIKFQNVTFRYPKDSSRKIFNNLSLQFDINKTGLVGESGCGKSTTFQLIMRFYDPEEGRITLDGHDLRTLDLPWLRSQIGYVGQQPVLFATTIKQNLLFGNKFANDEQIMAALKMAEAWDFVQSLEKQLQTYVGFGGGQLSGGQKQRLAIARAILRKPKIMLLDEATSALDRRNQKLIQKTLQKVTQGMTTITVAHRVKTIMNSDLIYVFDKGGISDKGKFHELTRFKSHFDEKDNEDVMIEKEVEKQEEIESKSLSIKQKTLATKAPLQIKKPEELIEEEQKQMSFASIFYRIFTYSKDKIALFLLGITCALISGVAYPVFTIFLASNYEALLKIDANPQDQESIDKINSNSLAFFLIGICGFVAITIQVTSLNVVGQSITRKIRIQVYKKILKMPVHWFDREKNNAGNLTVKLSTDCSTVNNITTVIFAVVLQNLSTLITGIVIALVYEWRIALVSIALLPFMVLNGVAQTAASIGFSDKTDAIYKESTSIIMEAMTNIRTVVSFGYEQRIVQRYDQKLEQPYQLAKKKGNLSGLLYGSSQFILFIIFGVQFYLGSIFMRDHPDQISIADMFTAIFALLLGGTAVGNNSHFISDIASAKNSAKTVFNILDKEDEDQMQIRQGSKFLKQGADGDIDFKSVSFKYEQRNQHVFQNLNISIKKGQKVAFVGPSGCGKSTIIQLLQRFYCLDNGKIMINGIDIKDFDIHYLRSRFGIVSQEPVLFNGTFAENIQYNLKNVTQQQIQKAAEKSNSLSFILGHEQTVEKTEGTGFDRNVGVRGSHISGGQKQRIAIARTILRDPEILLLDEATSALDRQNQKKVQDSLDFIMKGRTVASIAHRIETIKNSDEIFMFQKGKVIESGSYEELMEKKGHFYSLQKGASFV